MHRYQNSPIALSAPIFQLRGSVFASDAKHWHPGCVLHRGGDIGRRRVDRPAKINPTSVLSTLANLFDEFAIDSKIIGATVSFILPPPDDDTLFDDTGVSLIDNRQSSSFSRRSTVHGLDLD